jgi:hypothetical protein
MRSLIRSDSVIGITFVGLLAVSPSARAQDTLPRRGFVGSLRYLDTR